MWLAVINQDNVIFWFLELSNFKSNNTKITRNWQKARKINTNSFDNNSTKKPFPYKYHNNFIISGRKTHPEQLRNNMMLTPQCLSSYYLTVLSKDDDNIVIISSISTQHYCFFENLNCVLWITHSSLFQRGWNELSPSNCG